MLKRYALAAALFLTGLLGCAAAQAQVVISVANSGSTGTTVGSLAKLTGAPSTAVKSATTDTSGIIGIVVGETATATTGNAVIAIAGIASCTFDASGVTAGHYVQNSAVTAGDCADGGSTYPTSGQVLGVSLVTVGSGAANIVITPPVILPPGAGSGTVTSITCNSGLTGGAITTSGTCALDLAHANTFTAAQAYAEVHGTAYAPTLTSNAYTPTIADCGKTLLLPTGTTPSVHLPNLNPGTGECTIKMVQMTAGTSLYTIDAVSGGTVVSANSYTHTAKQYATVVVTLIIPSGSAATWDLSGEGS